MAGIHERIEGMVKGDEVVLFMKGTKFQPQCGFSAAVVGLLNDMGIDYETHNVLADPELRQGIKEFSNWPTIPQLYIKGEFQGGSDIVREMYAKGELHKKLGVDVPEPINPTVNISTAALDALKGAAKDADGGFLRLEIDAGFRHNLYFGEKSDGDIEVALDGLTMLVDPTTSRRADGLQLDYVDGPDGTGFKIENPNAPPQVKQLNVADLKAKLDAGEALELFDVRSADERAIAKIDTARALDPEGAAYLEKLPKDTMLVFHCHHGGRSQQAATHFLRQGFTNVYNLAGGIDAWSVEVDSDVPRY